MSPWRPPSWSSYVTQKVVINFPGQLPPAPQYSNAASGSSVVLPNSQTLYAFDADIQIEHQQDLRRTEHPVQTGASISDHAYIVPARLVMDVGISDAMEAYFNPTTWAGVSTSKSVSAYQTMLALQFSRIPLQILTKLRKYQNMVIESLTPQESVKTFAGLRMRIEFGQIFIADVLVPKTSARPQNTDTTTQGTLNPQPPSAAQTQQNAVPTALDLAMEGLLTPQEQQNAPPYQLYNSIGAGSWSSVPSQLSEGLSSK